MEFDISCSNCRAELTAEEEMIGTKLNCPACDHTITVKKAVNTIKGKVNRINKSGAKKDKVKYPSICKVAGIVLLLLSVGALLSLFKLNWNNPNQVHAISVAHFVLYLSSGLSLMLKKKMGVIGSYVILTSYGLMLVVLLALFKFKELDSVFIAITVVLGLVNILLICSAFSYNKWQEQMLPQRSL